MSDVGYSGIPEHCRDGGRVYIEKGVRPGHFLEAVFSNKLVESFGRADYSNIEKMDAYARFLYNEAPSACWGSKERVEKWIQAGGLEGRRKRDENSGTHVD